MLKGVHVRLLTGRLLCHRQHPAGIDAQGLLLPCMQHAAVISDEEERRALSSTAAAATPNLQAPTLSVCWLPQSASAARATAIT
jgi:hypothetical protein